MKLIEQLKNNEKKNSISMVIEKRLFNNLIVMNFSIKFLM